MRTTLHTEFRKFVFTQPAQTPVNHDSWGASPIAQFMQEFDNARATRVLNGEEYWVEIADEIANSQGGLTGKVIMEVIDSKGYLDNADICPHLVDFKKFARLSERAPIWISTYGELQKLYLAAEEVFGPSNG